MRTVGPASHDQGFQDRPHVSPALFPRQRNYGENQSRERGDAAAFRRDRWFESGSLQRGVRCEPDFRVL